MRKIIALLISALLLSFSACTQKGNRDDFMALYNAFAVRGEGIRGYEVSEIETYEEMEFFSVRVCLNTDDALVIDDYMWFEANALYFYDGKEAEEAFARNQESGMGGHCLKNGNILLYWMEKDPFSDLYNEVFSSVFG